MPTLLSPPLLTAVVAAALYELGRRRHARVVSAARLPPLRWRRLAFWAALVMLVVALDSVVDDEADRLFWVHMVQHVLLMMVAAPLLVLAAPWTPIWKGLSLRTRRRVAASYMRSPRWRPLRAAGRFLGRPLPVFAIFNVDLSVWHVPALYGLTLRSQAVHDLEHLSFLILAVLFWAQVLQSPPLRVRLGEPRRVAYVLGGATVCWLLALVLAFAPSPLYAAYSSHPGLSALGDQQLAAGIMLGPGSIPYAVFIFVALYRWLAAGATLPSEPAGAPGGTRVHPGTPAWRS
jgi:putative membrane protein